MQDFLKCVEPVELANAKLQSDAGTAALKLMDSVFTTEAMVNGNPSGVTKSKEQTIRPLSIRRIVMVSIQSTYSIFVIYMMCYTLLDFLREKWGVTTADS